MKLEKDKRSRKIMRTKTLKQKQQKEKYCENINEEFCQRAFSLFFSFYENPSIEEINTFPPAKPNTEKNTKKKNTIQNSILDLRLKRLQGQKQEEMQQIVESFEENIIEMGDALRRSEINLEQVFAPEPTQRPEKPKYLQNEEKDIEESKRKDRHRAEGINIIATQEKFQKKLDDAARKGKERAQKRYKQLSHSENQPQNRETPKNPPKNQISKPIQPTQPTGAEVPKTKLQYKPSVRYFPKH